MIYIVGMVKRKFKVKRAHLSATRSKPVKLEDLVVLFTTSLAIRNRKTLGDSTRATSTSVVPAEIVPYFGGSQLQLLGKHLKQPANG